MKHTPAPWRITHTASGHYISDKEDKILIADVCYRNDFGHEADAHRIVGCVNALEGIELAEHSNLLTKDNAHIYMHRLVRVYSDLTRKWRNEILIPYIYFNFYIGNSDFSRLQLGHPKQ